MTGYVAGYNKYLADTGVENLPDPRCRGAEWVKPISEIDVYRRFYQLALLASGTIAIDGIASSQPPLPDPEAQAGSQPRFNPDAKAADLAEALDDFPTGGIGSNGVGLGSEATATAAAWCSPTRTSPGTAPSASTRPTSPSPVS